MPEALNLIDDRRPERRAQALALLDRLVREGPDPGALRVGLTGAPGAGKSTLLDALVRAIRRGGETVGIVAVDPSSRVSGGALLGDRVRVRAGSRDPGVFLRSMAARDRLGGVADATHASVVVLATVFDWVFVETVGVGQSEMDVADIVDTLVFVAQPGLGDSLQFMKAGVLEHPDVFVVNKADLGAVAERTARELESAVAQVPRAPGAWRPPVLLASARDGRGIDAVVEALRAHRAHLERTSELRLRRERAREKLVHEVLLRRYGSFGLERIGGPDALRARLRERPDASPFALVAELGREIEDALRKTPPA